MNVRFEHAKPADAEVIACMVSKLTGEITARTSSRLFNISEGETADRCRALLQARHYAAILAYAEQRPIAVATFTETYALYAGGKIGLVQEFYVEPEFRAKGVGTRLIKEIREYGGKSGWACMELTTPPLPEFAQTLEFYQANGLSPVGGRKMRQYL